MSENISQKMANCYWGQCVGDALGSMVEFHSAEAVARKYPQGISLLEATEVFPDMIAGQLTDDSEMAVTLLRSMFDDTGTRFLGYDADRAFAGYVRWMNSDPIDLGGTTASGLSGMPNPSSQANGALMRVSPLAMACVKVDEATAVQWLRADAELTHPHELCQQANVIYGLLIRYMLLAPNELTDQELYDAALDFVARFELTLVDDIVREARTQPPSEYFHQMGWVRIALHNALYHLFTAEEGAAPGPDQGLHPSLAHWRRAVHETVMHGGDTDTNGAIVGALVGARYAGDVIPQQWLLTVKGAYPGRRPSEYWAGPAERLLADLAKSAYDVTKFVAINSL